MARSPTKKNHLLLSLVSVAMLAVVGTMIFQSPRSTRAAPEKVVYGSPVHASCYLATRSTCKIHIDPFTIQKSTGPQLLGFQLYANSTLIYDFKTDVSNPPITNYTPSLVKQDFAATCSRTYDIYLIAKDTDDPNYYVLGADQDVVCPQGTYDAYLPVINR